MASKVCHLILLVCFLVNTNGLSLRPPVKNCPRKLYCGYAAPCDTATCPKQTGARCYNDYCSNGCGKARFLDPYYNEVDCNCNGIKIFECKDLCLQAKCPGHLERDVNCRVNKCGGCKAVFYDRFAKPVTCKPKIDYRCPKVRSIASLPCNYRCSSNNDCSGQQICCDSPGPCGTYCRYPPVVTDPTCPRVKPSQESCHHECFSNKDCKQVGTVCCSNGCGTTCRKSIELDPKCPRLKPDTVGICIHQCSRSSDCKGNQICCSNGCGTICQNPHPVLDPRCPASEPTIAGICRQECLSTSDCKTKHQICCSNGCGTICRYPEFDRRCPKFKEYPSPIGLACKRSCLSNRDCMIGHLCCLTKRCGPQCFKRTPVTDRNCPLPRPRLPGVPQPICRMPTCYSNNDCKGNLVCCNVPGCGTVCTQPKPKTDPSCPAKHYPQAVALTNARCARPCYSNADCSENFICCDSHSVCGVICIPRKPVTDRNCPLPRPHLPGVPQPICRMPTCYSNNDCKGNLVCCNVPGCGTVCTQPKPITDPSCPAYNHMGAPPKCSKRCYKNSDCNSNQICCNRGHCGAVCINYPQGFDPRCRTAYSVASIKLPTMKQCSSTRDCKYNLICCPANPWCTTSYCPSACVPRPY